MSFIRAQNISTLDPSRLVASDFIDISNKRWHVGVRYHRISVIHWRYRETQPFPPETRGFLYLHNSRGVHPSAASLRFRICDKDLPPQESFARGKDLLLPSGAPWDLTLLQLFMSVQTRNFREGLLQDKVLPLEGIEHVDNLVNTLVNEGKTVKEGKRVRQRSRVLFSFGQPFSISMGVNRSFLSFVDLKTSKFDGGEIYTEIAGKFFFVSKSQFGLFFQCLSQVVNTNHCHALCV
ncbi:hypothetical protein BDP27DRAFT_175020 [Rhodocollybia butyracea]|uniref:Uncharacterized protein n=1 Tax=Rhodocollybia butyracea TaxID=206335 RepID=A0A9P5TVF8_9AGAR|nr:hypothetical protein BDP27DRAFT_175020 [Rhodocollybia butyracea]